MINALDSCCIFWLVIACAFVIVLALLLI